MNQIEIPNPESQIMKNKHQITNPKFQMKGIYPIVCYLEFGYWSLSIRVISCSSVAKQN